MDSIGMGGRFAPESVDELDRNMHHLEHDQSQRCRPTLHVRSYGAKQVTKSILS